MSNPTKPDFSRIPLGIPSFPAIRKDQLIYVDKTDKVVELIKSGRYLLLTRPRRFGKSLLTSTIAALFAQGREAVVGLKAEALWDENTRPVVRLDFSVLKFWSTREKLYAFFDDYLREAISLAGFQTDPASLKPVIRWMRFLSSQPESSVVVVVDEYDAPLTASLDDPERFRIVRELVAQFFDMSKAWAGKIRFLFVTGIMKFRQGSLFSTFNNISDVSLDPRFGTLLGYTRQELSDYFGSYVAYAALRLTMTPDALYERMTEMYDGFSFDERAETHVYAPWSVMSFLINPDAGLRHFWFDSAGSPAILVNYLKKHRLLAFEGYDSEPVVSVNQLTAADHIDKLDPRVLLTHAGYLTIKEAVDGSKVRLAYPNAEIRSAMAQLYRTHFWSEEFDGDSLAQRFVDAVRSCRYVAIIEILNEIVHQLDYNRFHLTDEGAVRELVQVFCIAADLPNRIEVHSPFGRSDLEISTVDFEAVFEFKYARNGQNSETLLKQAKDQLVLRDYGFARKSKPLHRIALVFSEVQRKFVHVAAVEK